MVMINYKVMRQGLHIISDQMIILGIGVSSECLILYQQQSHAVQQLRYLHV